jgi:hypothetical protein
MASKKTAVWFVLLTIAYICMWFSVPEMFDSVIAFPFLFMVGAYAYFSTSSSKAIPVIILIVAALINILVGAILLRADILEVVSYTSNLITGYYIEGFDDFRFFLLPLVEIIIFITSVVVLIASARYLRKSPRPFGWWKSGSLFVVPIAFVTMVLYWLVDFLTGVERSIVHIGLDSIYWILPCLGVVAYWVLNVVALAKHKFELKRLITGSAGLTVFMILFSFVYDKLGPTDYSWFANLDFYGDCIFWGVGFFVIPIIIGGVMRLFVRGVR